MTQKLDSSGHRWERQDFDSLFGFFNMTRPVQHLRLTAHFPQQTPWIEVWMLGFAIVPRWVWLQGVCHLCWQDMSRTHQWLAPNAKVFNDKWNFRMAAAWEDTTAVCSSHWLSIVLQYNPVLEQLFWCMNFSSLDVKTWYQVRMANLIPSKIREFGASSSCYNMIYVHMQTLLPCTCMCTIDMQVCTALWQRTLTVKDASSMCLWGYGMEGTLSFSIIYFDCQSRNYRIWIRQKGTSRKEKYITIEMGLAPSTCMVRAILHKSS